MDRRSLLVGGTFTVAGAAAAPAYAQYVDEAWLKPPRERPLAPADGRRATINNSGFGTVYGIVDGKPLPVCDHAGFAPFGFGYRRCPTHPLIERGEPRHASR